MLILGIDPGVSGALVAISSGSGWISSHIMPTIAGKFDVHGFVATLTGLIADTGSKPSLVIVEKVSAMPGQGVVSMFSFGQTFGSILGALAAYQWPTHLVTPQRWQKMMHEGVEKSLPPKARSLIVAQRLFPGLDLKATPRCKKPHDGICDALLLAEYGRRMVLQGFVEEDGHGRAKR